MLIQIVNKVSKDEAAKWFSSNAVLGRRRKDSSALQLDSLMTVNRGAKPTAFTHGEFYRKPGLLLTFSLKRNNEKITTL